MAETPGKTAPGDTGSNKNASSAQQRIAEQNERNKAAQQDRIAAAATPVKAAATPVKAAPAAAAANPIAQVLQSIQQQPASTVGAPAPPTVNTAAANPDVSYAIGEMKKRYAGDNGASEAATLATSQARDLGTGLLREAGANASSRGVSGTGVDDFNKRNILGGVARSAAASTAQIGLERQQQKDQTLNSIAGAGGQNAQIMQQQQDNAQRQWEAAEAARQRIEDQRQAREMSLLQLMTSLAA